MSVKNNFKINLCACLVYALTCFDCNGNDTTCFFVKEGYRTYIREKKTNGTNGNGKSVKSMHVILIRKIRKNLNHSSTSCVSHFNKRQASLCFMAGIVKLQYF